MCQRFFELCLPTQILQLLAPMVAIGAETLMGSQNTAILVFLASVLKSFGNLTQMSPIFKFVEMHNQGTILCHPVLVLTAPHFGNRCFGLLELVQLYDWLLCFSAASPDPRDEGINSFLILMSRDVMKCVYRERKLHSRNDKTEAQHSAGLSSI